MWCRVPASSHQTLGWRFPQGLDEVDGEFWSTAVKFDRTFKVPFRTIGTSEVDGLAFIESSKQRVADCRHTCAFRLLAQLPPLQYTLELAQIRRHPAGLVIPPSKFFTQCTQSLHALHLRYQPFCKPKLGLDDIKASCEAGLLPLVLSEVHTLGLDAPEPSSQGTLVVSDGEIQIRCWEP